MPGSSHFTQRKLLFFILESIPLHRCPHRASQHAPRKSQGQCILSRIVFFALFKLLKRCFLKTITHKSIPNILSCSENCPVHTTLCWWLWTWSVLLMCNAMLHAYGEREDCHKKMHSLHPEKSTLKICRIFSYIHATWKAMERDSRVMHCFPNALTLSPMREGER